LNTAAQSPMSLSADLQSAVARAMQAIAPSWPLDRQIAVNPYWGFIDQPFAQAAGALRGLIGARFTLEPREYLRAWVAGEITPATLAQALAEQGLPVSLDEAVAALTATRPPTPGLPLPSDIADQGPGETTAPTWRDTITQQVSQYCASYFDEHQADWHRGRVAGLFAGWHAGLETDHSLESLMHAPEIRRRIRQLPATPESAIAWSLNRLGVETPDTADFLTLCLLRINGWASWCAYLAWEARLGGATDTHLQELLAIRVSWEAVLDDGSGLVASLGSRWREHWAQARDRRPAHLDALDLAWQRAHEISYEHHLIAQLSSGNTHGCAPGTDPRPDAQLVFCIDVRSERFRRALESVNPALQTRGFAGFFGLPLRYTPIGTRTSQPQLPGLLAPGLEATDSTGSAAVDTQVVHRRARHLDHKRSWLPFQRLPSAAFSLVETLGMTYAGAILRRCVGGDTPPVTSIGLAPRDRRALRPRLCLADGASVRDRTQPVASALRAMGLTRSFARLVVFAGHGSQSANNAHAAALDCGACGGQTGEINARLLAGLFNDRAVRAELRVLGIDVPESAVAVAALHNTTTDEVELFDLESLPTSHEPDVERLRISLAAAGHATRAERAPSLGLSTLSDRPRELLSRVRRRARDWAQTRPEWGLADNAAFIVAPRSRTRGLNLAGRAFLHDYAWVDDADGKVLELIMTAPMVVTHWINMQYYASTVDPGRFGSGNKVLHNVACGRIGVFEGNTGDLRIGLARQSLHNGERWMHAPLRLSVFIDAPREMIERVIEQHGTVRHLVLNRWLYLYRFADSGIERFSDGNWTMVSHQ